MPSIGNMHLLVASAVSVINPFVAVTISHSDRFTQGGPQGQFDRTPAYTISAAAAQIQALDWKEMAQLDGINTEGGARKIYVKGVVAGVLRGAQTGGDLVTFPPNTPGIFEGPVWLVVKIFEQWPGWASAAIVVQNGS